MPANDVHRSNGLVPAICGGEHGGNRRRRFIPPNSAAPTTPHLPPATPAWDETASIGRPTSLRNWPALPFVEGTIDTHVGGGEFDSYETHLLSSDFQTEGGRA